MHLYNVHMHGACNVTSDNFQGNARHEHIQYEIKRPTVSLQQLSFFCSSAMFRIPQPVVQKNLNVSSYSYCEPMYRLASADEVILP